MADQAVGARLRPPSRVFLPIAMLVAVGLSGCAGSGQEQEGDSDAPASIGYCQEEYPDGTPFDCETTEASSEGLLAGEPERLQGWACLNKYEETDQGLGWTSLWMHEDGRVGYAWDWSMPREGGAAFVAGGLYYRDGSGGMVRVVPYQKTGFALFPELPAQSEAEVHLLLSHFLLDAKVGDGPWHEVADAEIVVGSSGGHAWYVWKFDDGFGNETLSMMEHDPDDESQRQWTPRKQIIEDPQRSFVASTWGTGIKYTTVQLVWDPARTVGC